MNLQFVTRILTLVQYLFVESFLIDIVNARPIGHRFYTNQVLKLDDLAITVKTTQKNHETRLIDILDTWFDDAPVNTFFITDLNNAQLNKRLNGKLIATNCSQGHDHQSLNCKMQKELEVLAKVNAKWSCRFDDDNYVNIPQLLHTLSKYDHTLPFYIGRPSIDHPIRIDDAEFWFGTGGAGICLSRPLLHKIYPYIGKFQKLTHNFVAPDDVTLGYLINSILKVPLTNEPSFNSHLHKLTPNQFKSLDEQSTLGPMSPNHRHLNLLGDKDRQLFYTIHCHNFPDKCSKLMNHLTRR